MKPLYKASRRGTSGSRWKQAYQAIKHDRKKSLEKATVLNLLHAMGALYILNLYYRDERLNLGYVYHHNYNIDTRFGSELFSSSYYEVTSLSFLLSENEDYITPGTEEQFEHSVHILKLDDGSFQNIYKRFYE